MNQNPLNNHQYFIHVWVNYLATEKTVVYGTTTKDGFETEEEALAALDKAQETIADADWFVVFNGKKEIQLFNPPNFMFTYCVKAGAAL